MAYRDTMTFETILEQMLSAVPDTVDKREGSIIYDALAPCAILLTQVYAELDMILDESFADTCSLEYLIKRCKERGVPIQGATPAVIEGKFTPLAVKIPPGSRFNYGDLNYIVTEQISDGRYKLECETDGKEGNQYSGFLLPIQFIEGLETAEIAGVLIPGEEGDDTESLRERYFDSLNSLSYGGNVADYKVPTALLVESVQTALDPVENGGEGVGIAPIGHTVTVAGVTPAPITVQTNLTFVTGYDYASSKTLLENAIKDYLADLSKSWEDEQALVVRISQIENKLLNLACVLDISDTTVNGAPKNLELGGSEIPTLNALEVVG